MRDAADYVPDPEDGPCRQEDHDLARRSRSAFEARTLVIGVQTLDGESLLLGNCWRCKTTLAIPLEGETR